MPLPSSNRANIYCEGVQQQVVPAVVSDRREGLPYVIKVMCTRAAPQLCEASPQMQKRGLQSCARNAELVPSEAGSVRGDLGSNGVYCS
jgi:hypothetical protein